MRTYYQDGEIEITSVEISVEGVRYPLTDLDRIWRRGSSPALRGVAAGLGVIAGALIYRLVASAAWWFGGLRSWYGWLATHGTLSLALLGAGVLAMALLGVLAFEAVLLGVEYLRGHGRYRELWASVWGEDVLLLRTSDSDRFERVCRALRRATGDQPGTLGRW